MEESVLELILERQKYLSKSDVSVKLNVLINFFFPAVCVFSVLFKKSPSFPMWCLLNIL